MFLKSMFADDAEYNTYMRDYFAGQALAGLMSATDSAGTWTTTDNATNYAAQHAYKAADAMLAERKSHEADRAFKEVGL